MKISEVVTLDFETLPIQKRPDYPPKPVSMSIQMPHWPAPRFFAWGHLTGGNNCTQRQAQRILHAARATQLPVLCHHAKFDTDVAETHMDVEPWPWELVHDTQFLLFLVDPYARNLGLKESAHKRLKMPPDERDVVRDWILEHKVQLEADFPEIVAVHGGIKPSTASAFIAYAPGNVVEPYANGDDLRTLKLFRSCYKEVVQRKMLVAYDRERKLLPILLRNEREGIRCDLPRLRETNRKMEDSLIVTDTWLRKKLRTPDLNCDSGDDVVEALIRTKLGDNFIKTPTGKDSRSVESIEQAVTDKSLKSVLQYRTRLTNQHRNFVKGWLGQAEKTGGQLHTSWNQVKNGDDDLSGARTGRLSTDKPLNLLATTKKLGKKSKGATHPKFLGDVLVLPWLRSFLLPDDEDSTWIRRDQAQQEFRIAAHYEEGSLYRAYRSDYETDVHKLVQSELLRIMNVDLDRDNTKTINFAILFKLGLAMLAVKTDRSIDEAKSLRTAHAAALPDIAQLDKDLQACWKAGEPIRTFGGREYYVEESRAIKGQMRDFAYRALNLITQGGGADITKEILIRYDETQGRRARMLGPVHDEFNISAKKGQEHEETALLREVIGSIELDVPLLSDCEMGSNWGEVTKYVETPPDLSRWAQ